MATVICLKLPPPPEFLKLTLPGLGEMQYLCDSVEKLPRPSTMLLRFLNSSTPVLSPIMGVIKLLDMIQAIIACITAIPKSIMTMSPGPLLKCFEKLFKALSALIQLMPPFPYIKLILDMVKLIRLLVEDLLSIVRIIDDETSRIKNALLEAQHNNDTELLSIAECARDNLQQQMTAFMQVLTLLGKLLGLIFTLLDLIAALVPGASEKIDEWKSSFDDATGSFGGSAITGFVQLAPVVTALRTMRTILCTIEQFGSMILGLPYSAQALVEFVVRN